MDIKKIIQTIENKKIRLGIIGLGYVGLPLAVEFAKAGVKTMGFEISASKVQDITKGKSYIDDVPNAIVKKLSASALLKATTKFSELKKQDCIIICVPTPLRKSKDPDVSYILTATKEIAKNLKKGQIIIFESTTYPGTTRELVKPILEEKGLKAGKDFFLAFSPERVDPGNKTYTISNTPKVVGGITKACTLLATAIYKLVTNKVLPVSNTETAEIVKLLENTFRAVNIAMVNEFALMCNKLNLDIWEIMEAAASKPFGFMPFYPGPGIGGHCIPLDPHYLGWKMKTLNFEPRFIELASAINSHMPEYTANRIAELLNIRKKALSASKILLIGIAYKADITDHRESPARDVFLLLKKTGATVNYHDPYIPKAKINGKNYKSVKITMAVLRKYDCVAIMTRHSNVNYKSIVKNSKLIFDARNALKDIKSKKIFKL
ncbi:MAG: nucleotide sugar dehydrogenase [Elusimicrobiales bacterium]|nr:nucleotide sugar dehydrogenase [Elusimicrobiales bacterium]